MGVYLHKFATQAECDAYTGDSGSYVEPFTALIAENGAVLYNVTSGAPGPTPVYSAMPLTFEFLGSGSIGISAPYTPSGSGSGSGSGPGFTPTLSYRINDGEWSEINFDGQTGYTVSVSNGDKLQLKGSKYYIASGTSIEPNNGILVEIDEINYIVYGNIMSLYSENFVDLTAIQEDCHLECMFNSMEKLTSAENLILPAISLQDGCYYHMFSGCTSLTTAPELPATTLTQECYAGMFAGCTNLTTAPSLPAVTLSYMCYGGMFGECTNLIAAPALPATTLDNACYISMFRGCTSITTAPELPATTLQSSCYKGMFLGCTSLTTAPELPATALTYYCYDSMFSGCTSLNYIKCLAITTQQSYYPTNNWVDGVSSTGIFYKPTSASWWGRGVSGIPEGWTVEDA